MKDLWTTGQTKICRQIQDNQDLRNDFHRAGKNQKERCKILGARPKNEENFENFQENFEIFLMKISTEN